MRKFEEWLKTFKDNVASWNYYNDFEKIYKNVDKYKEEIKQLDLIIKNSKTEKEFEDAIRKSLNVLALIPILMAKRGNKIQINTGDSTIVYDFKKLNHTADKYIDFLKKTSVFDMLKNHVRGSVYDYLIGLEVGMDTNARKNRTGKVMENIVEDHIKSLGYIKNKNYWSQLSATKIKQMFNVDVTNVDSEEKANKRFDFVIFENNVVYAIECNFYNGGGSKLNEVARSYKGITLESQNIRNFKFIWITDGYGWNSAKNNLKETFDVLDSLYNLNDLNNGELKKLLGK